METIQTLDAAVQANTSAVSALVAHLSGGGTVLSAADQTTLDADVAAINASTATLAGLVAPVAPPAE
jgi:hypothetical protein